VYNSKTAGVTEGEFHGRLEEALQQPQAGTRFIAVNAPQSYAGM
jgi:hypothetical protein